MAGTREIPLTKGAVAIVDEVEYDRLVSMGSWHLSDTGYAVRRTRGHTIRMHRLINNTPEGFDTDHISRNRLDNRRSNLRTATRKENMLNKEPGKGYWFHGQNKNWVVELQGTHVGVFSEEGLAAQVAFMILNQELPLTKIKEYNVFCKRGHNKELVGTYGSSCRTCILENQKAYYRRKNNVR